MNRFKNLESYPNFVLPEITEEENRELEQSILQHGSNYSPVIICRGTNYIIDGNHAGKIDIIPSNKGRFPANLIVSDDVLNNGKISREGKRRITKAAIGIIYKYDFHFLE